MASELKYRFFDEGDPNRLIDVMWQCRQATRFVMQGPMLSAYCHLLPMTVVFMMRTIEDIIASERRIGWQHEQSELDKYFSKQGPISRVKYKMWEEFQRPKLETYFELEYDSMEGHPMWIDKENRLFFTAKQTEIGAQIVV